MVVGILELKLVVRDARSLKDKRRVVKSVKDRISARFNVSVAEVDRLDARQHAVLGAAVVSNSASHAVGQLSKVVDLVRAVPSAELADYSIETL